MINEEIKNLLIDEFDKLAKEQSKKFPDLLFFREEEEIIDDFYEYYHRKRIKNQ